jgi:hypothetical protein
LTQSQIVQLLIPGALIDAREAVRPCLFACDIRNLISRGPRPVACRRGPVVLIVTRASLPLAAEVGAVAGFLLRSINTNIKFDLECHDRLAMRERC